MGFVIGGVVFIVGLLASVIAIWQVIWPFFKRRILKRPDPQTATTKHIDALAQQIKAGTDALAQQIKDLEAKVTQPPTYLDGLPEAVNEKLRAAYQEARILQLEGYAAQSDHKHREAIDRFTRALELAENDSQRAALHNLRGNSYSTISEYNKAEADYQETLKLAARISPERDAAEARAAALGNLGNVYRERGDLEGAEEHYKSALAIAREIGDRLGQANALGGLGLVYYRRGELEKAEEHHKKALEIYREIGNRLGEAQALGNLGLVYDLRGELEKAEEHHKKALEIDREIGNRLGEAQGLGNLGLVHARRGELEKAEEYHKQALKIDREIGNRLGEARQLGNLGAVYARRGGPGDLDKAEEDHKQALDIHREIGNRLGEANQLGNLGLVHARRGELAKARERLQQAQAIYQKIGAGGEGPEKVRRALERIAEQEREQPERGE